MKWHIVIVIMLLIVMYKIGVFDELLKKFGLKENYSVWNSDDLRNSLGSNATCSAKNPTCFAGQKGLGEPADVYYNKEYENQLNMKIHGF